MPRKNRWGYRNCRGDDRRGKPRQASKLREWGILKFSRFLENPQVSEVLFFARILCSWFCSLFFFRLFPHFFFTFFHFSPLFPAFSKISPFFPDVFSRVKIEWSACFLGIFPLDRINKKIGLDTLRKIGIIGMIGQTDSIGTMEFSENLGALSTLTKPGRTKVWL